MQSCVVRGLSWLHTLHTHTVPASVLCLVAAAAATAAYFADCLRAAVVKRASCRPAGVIDTVADGDII